jgi:hypothetical protein
MAAPVAPPAPAPAPPAGSPGRFERAMNYIANKRYGEEEIIGSEEEVYHASRDRYVELSARFRRHTVTPAMKRALDNARDGYIQSRDDLITGWGATDEQQQEANVTEYIQLEHDISDRMVNQVENKRLAGFYDTIWTKRGILGKALVSAGVGIAATAVIPMAGLGLGGATAVAGAAFGSRLVRRAVTGKLKKEAGITQLANERLDHNVERFDGASRPDKISNNKLAESLRTAEIKERRKNIRSVAGTMAAVVLMPRVVEVAFNAADGLLSGAWDATETPREFVFRGVPDWMPLHDNPVPAEIEAKVSAPDIEPDVEETTSTSAPETEDTTPSTTVPEEGHNIRPETDTPDSDASTDQPDFNPFDGEEADAPVEETENIPGIDTDIDEAPDAIDGTVSGGADVSVAEMTQEQQLAEFNRIVEANGWSQQQGIDVLNLSSAREQQIAELVSRGVDPEDAAEIADRNFANLS